MTHVDAVQRWLTLLVLVSSALAALLYLSRATWRGFQLVQRIHDLVEHELTPNSGSSIRDDVTTIAQAMGNLERNVRESKDAGAQVHELLQLQIDTLRHDLGLPAGPPHPQHRREESDG